jgi:hypothetical protein
VGVPIEAVLGDITALRADGAYLSVNVPLDDDKDQGKCELTWSSSSGPIRTVPRPSEVSPAGTLMRVSDAGIVGLTLP